MDIFLFTKTDRRNQRADTDTCCPQVADFIDLQTSVKSSGAGQDIFDLIRCHRIQTAAEGVELDQFQVFLSFYKLGRFIQSGVVHPLVRDDERTFNFGQMRDTVLCQYSNAIGCDQFRYAVIDFFIDMVWTAGKYDALHMVIAEIFDRFFTFIFHILAGSGQFIPGSFDSHADFFFRNIF